jgi:prolyl 4-hydroxylase
MKTIHKFTEEICVIKQALDEKFCQELIEISENIGYGEAPITTSRGPVMNKSWRSNSRVIYDSEDLASQLWPLIKDYLEPTYNNRTLIGLNERFRFYRYYLGQIFDWHYDGYYMRDNGEKSQFTLMFYLNDDFEGGTTDFEKIKITPSRGDALIFWHHQQHRGSSITQGKKYVLRTDVMYSIENE